MSDSDAEQAECSADDLHQELPNALIEELNQLAIEPEKKEHLAKVISASYEGPLPIPRHFAEYEEILPGSAERILQMAEKRHESRIEAEKVMISIQKSLTEAEIRDKVEERIEKRRGQIFALVICTFLIAAGVTAICQGHPGAGATIITACVVGLASVFVYGTHVSDNAGSEEANGSDE